MLSASENVPRRLTISSSESTGAFPSAPSRPGTLIALTPLSASNVRDNAGRCVRLAACAARWRCRHDHDRVHGEQTVLMQELDIPVIAPTIAL